MPRLQFKKNMMNRCKICGIFKSEKREHICFKNTPDLNKRRSETIKRLIQEGKFSYQFKKGNITWCTGLTKENDPRLREIGKKISERNKGKIPWNLGRKEDRIEVLKRQSTAHLGQTISEETRNKLKEKLTGKKYPAELYPNKGWRNKKMPLSARINISKAQRGSKRPEMSRRNKDPEFQKKCHRHDKITTSEQKFIKIIQKYNLPFNYVGNGQIWFQGDKHIFNPDFLSKNPKHIIEIFGDYWHNLPENKSKDQERFLTYSRHGYKCLVVWEHELLGKKRLPEKEIITKINKFIFS